MLQETQGGGRKWRCSMEMGFWGSAPKFCAGRQEQVTAQVIVLGLCAEYSPKLFPELMWSVSFLAIGGQEKYQVFGELLKECLMHSLNFEALLKLMSSLVVSLSSIFHSECKPEKNLAFKMALTGKSFCLQEFNHPLCLRDGERMEQNPLWPGAREGKSSLQADHGLWLGVNVQDFCAFPTKINYICSTTLCGIAMSTQLHKFTIWASVCLHEMFQLYFLQ